AVGALPLPAMAARPAGAPPGIIFRMAGRPPMDYGAGLRTGPMRAEILYLAGRTALLVAVTGGLDWLLAWIAPPLPPFLVAAVVIAPVGLWLLRRAHTDRVARDAAEAGRARAEEQRRYRDRWSTALLEHSSDLVSILDGDGTIRFASPSHERVLGYTPEELVGRNSFELLHPDDRAAVLGNFRDGIALSGPTTRSEYRIRHRNGSWRVVESAARAALDDPVLAGVVVSSRDVTARRRAESDKAALLALAHDIAGTLDLDEVLMRVQQRTVEVLPCEGVATLGWDAGTQSYRLRSQVGLPAALAAVARDMVISSGTLMPADSPPSGATVVVNDLSAGDQPIMPLLAAHGITAFAACGLEVRGRLVGVLVAIKTDQHRFHPPQIQLLESIARQLAMAVGSADLYAAQREEAAVAAALARVGRELIGQLEQPALLERLCRLTVEVFGCEVSRTYLLDAERGLYGAVATSGEPSEQWAAVQALQIPQAVFESYMPELRAGADVVQVDLRARAAGDAPLSGAHAAERVLMMALRRGGEMVGLHAARFHARREPCSAAQERIAGGVAQLASLALDNARLIEALDRADRVKSDFVASMSHELRTPLNVIIGYSDLLADQMFGELTGEQQDTVRRIAEQGRELLELVNTTLDMSRLESERLPVVLQEVDLIDLLAEIELEAQLVRRNAALAITWDVAADLPPVCSDPVKLRVIIKNLLLNAIKFTDDGGVVVRVVPRDAGVEVAVSDTGIGIAPELLPVIFDAFRQGDHGGERRGGVGLGLHIVRRLLDMLGGTIEVESVLGAGSTFRVWIPGSAAAQAVGEARTAAMR
ncbi:MAG: ATP-binding protein, partial [Candidatus Binatia bacterium]